MDSTQFIARTSQPQNAVGIDWSNPITLGLLNLFLGSLPSSDLVTGTRFTQVGAPSSVPTQVGLGLAVNAATPTAIYEPAQNAPVAGWTQAAIIVSTGTLTSANSIVGFSNGYGSGNYGRSICQAYTGSSVWTGYIYDGAQKFAYATTPIVTGVPQVVVVTCTASLMSIYINGLLQGTVAVGNSGEIYGTPVWNIGRAGSGSAANPVEIPLALMSGVVWSAAQVASFSANPWQLFAPQRRNVFVGLSVGGAGIWNLSVSETAAGSDAPAASAPISLTVVEAALASDPDEGFSSTTYPIIDVTTTGWLTTGSTYSGVINEPVENDADYITSPTLGTGSPITLTLREVFPAGSYNFNFAAKYTGSSGHLTATLLDASFSSVGASSAQALTSGFAAYQLPVTTTGSAVYVQISVSV